jgi:DNA-binding MarR family transcriptional regulator
MGVFPLKPRSKSPATRHGHRDASTDPRTIGRWRPDANYGVGLGNGFLVFDADDEQAIEDARRWGLPPTFTVRTTHGYHLYYAYDTSIPTRCRDLSANKYGPFGIQTNAQIKAAGGYVVGPGSIHPDGPTYAIVNGRFPVQAPAWLLDAARAEEGDLDDAVVLRRGSTLVLRDRQLRVLARTQAKLADTSDGKNRRILAVIHELISAGFTSVEIGAEVSRSPLFRAWMGKPGRGFRVLVQTITKARAWRQRNPAVNMGVDLDAYGEAVREVRDARQMLVLTHLLRLASEHAASKGGTRILVSSRDIAAATGLTPATAHKTVRILEATGWVTELFRGTGPNKPVLALCARVAQTYLPASSSSASDQSVPPSRTPSIDSHIVWAHRGMASAFPAYRLLASDRGATVREVASELGEHRTTALRQLRLLVEQGLVISWAGHFFARVRPLEWADRAARTLGVVARLRRIAVSILRTRWVRSTARRLWLSQRDGRTDAWPPEPDWTEDNIRSVLRLHRAQLVAP